MAGGRAIPAAGIALALVAGVVMLVAGVSVYIVAASLLVWIGSLWLAAAPPEPARRTTPPDAMQLTLTGMGSLFEHSGLPMLLLHGERIVFANAAAREALGGHVVGQDARVAFRHPAAIELLSRPEGGSATISGLIGPRSNWQFSRQPIDERYSYVELINRTAEADVSRAHTDFVANASHELRTPLASIIGYMETLVDEGEQVEPTIAARFQATVLREARRLQSLVADLMSLSRVEAERHDQPSETVELKALLAQASRDGAGLDRAERLATELANEPLAVRGDRQQLEQLVRNLVDNAFKYGAADGTVTVGLRQEGADAVLSVRDEGDGIAPEHIPHLTRRFYRTDPGRSRAAGGTGLGLAIVKHIVERHRGRIDIASRQPVGTTVSITLPLKDGTSEQPCHNSVTQAS